MPGRELLDLRFDQFQAVGNLFAPAGPRPLPGQKQAVRLFLMLIGVLQSALQAKQGVPQAGFDGIECLWILENKGGHALLLKRQEVGGCAPSALGLA